MDNEELLNAWLQLGCIIDNQRLVTDLPFNEALVCGILFRAGEPLTASDLCTRTRILKSQMNAILRSLESKGFLARRPSVRDGRRVELELLPAGVERYNASHRHTLVLVDRLTARLGEEKTRSLTLLLTEAAQAFAQIIKEV
mgnify:FL=1